MRDRTDKTNPTMKVIIAAGTTRALVRRAKQCGVNQFGDLLIDGCIARVRDFP
jgi:hypothetical protein